MIKKPEVGKFYKYIRGNGHIEVLTVSNDYITLRHCGVLDYHSQEWELNWFNASFEPSRAYGTPLWKLLND